MLCIKPFKPRPGVEFGCGQCLPCRINRRRMWTARIVLESAFHAKSCFFTLTYAPEWLPDHGTLVPAHLEEFRYKVRYRYGPFRYYFVGEYGERSQRPHYHGLLFGLLPTREELESVWARGGCHVGTLTVDSAAYCAGYVTKKWTNFGHDLLNGRHPEFARMSRRPGLGSKGLSGIIDWLYSDQGAAYIARYHDVPLGVRFDGKIYPLGRYLVGKLREEFNIPSTDPYRQELMKLRQIELAAPEVMAARNVKRENQYNRAVFYKNLRRSMEKI